MDVLGAYANRIIVMNEGEKMFDGDKDSLFSHPKFDKMNLDYPSSIKVMKHLHKEISLPYKLLYTMDEVIYHIKEHMHE